MEIDVRKKPKKEEPIDVIRFAEDCILQRLDGLIYVTPNANNWAAAVAIETQEDALHLMDALEKAIELGWWK